MKAISHFVAELSARVASRQRPDNAALAATLICVIGIGLRVYVYAVDRSLWFDEAVLALNLVHRSLGELFPPFEYSQVAPLGFLWTVKAFMLVLGNTDYVLRLVPVLAGIGAVPLTYALAKRWSGGWAPLLALGMFALAPAIIYYSTEIKQYSSDVLATVVLLLAGWACIEKEHPARQFIILGLAGLLAMWFSHPSFFVLGGVLLTLAVSLLHRRNWPQLWHVLTLGILFAANFGVIYVTSLRQWAGDPGLSDLWQGSFAPLSGLNSASWYGQALANVSNPTTPSAGLLVTFLFLIGVVSLGLRSGWALAMAMTPVLAGLLASALHLYPFSGRFLLFTAPIALVLTAEGIDRIRRLLARWRSPLGTVVAIICAGAMLYGPARNDLGWIQSPPMRDHIKPVLAYLSHHRQPSDVIYLYYMAIPQYRYYAPFYDLEDMVHIDGIASRGHPVGYLADINALVGKPRVWLVFSHVYRSGKLDEQVYFSQHLDQIGTRLDEYYSSGVTIYLYDFTNPPPG